jgi:threonine/homoserine/homoserine lactone efflux protein
MVHNFRGRILTMSVQLLKPAGLRLMTSRTDTAVKKKSGIPWYGFFAGGIIYTILAVVLFAESTSSVLAWISAICAPGGFYFAWVAWNRKKTKQ